MKIYMTILTILNLICLGLSAYNLNETKKLQNDVGLVEMKLNRLDIDTLEKIKKQETMDLDCNSDDPNNWLKSSICN